MIGRVPVLGQHHRVEIGHQVIDRGHDFIAARDGQPAANITVTLTPGGSRYRDSINEIKVTTNAQGEFTVTWPTAGAYWLEAELKDDKTSLPQAKERRLTYAGTLEVLP